MKRKSRPGKVNFAGFTIVSLPDVCTRTATKFYRNGVCAAIHQKNGNIAISNSGIFDTPNSARARLRVAQCLHGLKLIGDDMLAGYQKQYDAWDRDYDITSLRNQAEDLGLTVPASWK